MTKAIDAKTSGLPLPWLVWDRKADGKPDVYKPIVGLGFSKNVIERLKSIGSLYFMSWSQDWSQPQEFAKTAFFYDYDQIEMLRQGKETASSIQVRVEGPYDLDAFSEEYLPYSVFESMEQAKLAREEGEAAGYTHAVYLWQAHVIKVGSKG